MSAAPRQRDLLKVLADLESGEDIIHWTERRDLAVSLGKSLQQAEDRDLALRLFHVLADDPKWEVRKEIACLLPLLPDDEFRAAGCKADRGFKWLRAKGGRA